MLLRFLRCRMFVDNHGCIGAGRVEVTTVAEELASGTVIGAVPHHRFP